MSKVCNIFFFEGWLGVAPTVINLCYIFSNNDFSVNVFITKTEFKLPLLPKEIRIIEADSYDHFHSDLNRRNRDIFAKFHLGCINYFLNNIEIFGGSEIINIGIDYFGSYVAYIISEISSTKFIFLSLELFETIEANHLNEFEKISAGYFINKSLAVIIQDKERLESLKKFLNINKIKTFYLPNSPVQNNCKLQKENYLRDKLAINTSFKTIILYAGMIGENSLTYKFSSAFAKIRNTAIALILHDRIEFDNSIIEKYHDLNSINLFISSEPVEIHSLPNIFNSCDIGIVTYAEIGDNFTLISKASGKLGYFLMLGKPIIVNNIPSLAQIINKYKCGKVIYDISNPDEWEKCISKIITNYESYSNNAKECFSREFSIDIVANEIIEFSLNNSTTPKFKIINFKNISNLISLQYEYLSLQNKDIHMLKELTIKPEKIKSYVYNTYDYKIGKLILMPFRFFKKFLKVKKLNLKNSMLSICTSLMQGLRP